MYDSDFYNSISSGASSSAAVIVPLVLKEVKVESVLDVGCGRGTWLAAFEQEKIIDFVGVDGDYVDRTSLVIPKEKFTSADLTQPFECQRRFDLVVSLEVAEHIPIQFAESFVNSLTRHGDTVLFSAAVPGQGGTSHVNEQAYEYWVKKFNSRGYRLFDFIRPKIQAEEYVEEWYKYNILFFANERGISRLSEKVIAAEIPEGVIVRSFAPLRWRVSAKLFNILPNKIANRWIVVKHKIASVIKG